MFYAKNAHCTKTGSGHTSEKNSQKKAFSCCGAGDPFAINSSGQLALHYASSRNRLDCARLLLEACGGERAAAMASFPDRGDNTPLHRAAAAGLTDMVTVLLEAGAVLSAVDRDGSTALHLG
jgi:ankyrin repeat protein|eukprot:COSAG06_NODE_5660_length_3336_cov_3.981464_5_plen_122_part_00